LKRKTRIKIMKFLTKPLRELPKGLPSMNDRLEWLRCALGYPVPSFAVKVGAMKGSIKKVLEGKADPNMKIMQNVLAILPVRDEWLFLGTGKPFKMDDVSAFTYQTERTKDDAIDVEVNERFREIRLEKDLSQPVFGAALGISKDIVASIETGRSSITVPLLKKFLKKYNVGESWMLWGVGNKYKK
jgi:DNA-binding XRE family transcriptional regulator